MKTQFTKGKWIETIHDYIKGEIFIYCNEKPIIRIAINNYATKSEAEAIANSKLIAAAPEMFYRTVLLANSEGCQYAFDLIEKVTGKKYTFNSKEFNILVEEAKAFFIA